MRQFRDWQFTKGAVAPPQAYSDYVLCTKLYHCTPDVLDQQSALAVDLHLEFWIAEQRQQSGKKRMTRGQRRRRG